MNGTYGRRHIKNMKSRWFKSWRTQLNIFPATNWIQFICCLRNYSNLSNQIPSCLSKCNWLRSIIRIKSIRTHTQVLSQRRRGGKMKSTDYREGKFKLSLGLLLAYNIRFGVAPSEMKSKYLHGEWKGKITVLRKIESQTMEQISSWAKIPSVPDFSSPFFNVVRDGTLLS